MSEYNGYICRFMRSDTEKQFATLKEARAAAEDYVGNSAASLIFGGTDDERWLYGPGTGEATVMVMKNWTRL